MEPFGIQIVIYLFLAGIAAGAGFMGSLALNSRKTVALEDGTELPIYRATAIILGALAASAKCTNRQTAV